MPCRALLVCFCLFFIGHISLAQAVIGEVTDKEDHAPINMVDIRNVYTNTSILSDDKGKFSINAGKGQLLEFKKSGYKTVRVRIPEGYLPSYFKIILQKGEADQVPQYVKGHTNRYDYTDDSIRFHDIYKHELDFPKMSTLDMINHPFSAMSKQNREIWDFQEDYTATQQQKYVDNTFNAKLITDLTGLKGDSLNYYMAHYRPAYQQLRNMNDYTFFNYIKKSVQIYRQRGRSNSRSNR